MPGLMRCRQRWEANGGGEEAGEALPSSCAAFLLL